MKAYRLIAGGEGLTLTRVAIPSRRPGPGQIALRMKAASLNFRDLLIAEGRYGPSVKPGVIPLSDGCGDVIEVGEGVSRFAVGDRATPIFSTRWMAGPLSPKTSGEALGGAKDGLLSEVVICDEQAAVSTPAHLTDVEAACFSCAGVTAWAALFGPRPVTPGQTVLTLGLGGVSSFAIQFARVAGAKVIATSSSSAKLEDARALGACEVVNYKENPDWEREVLRLTGGRGVDHVIETGGGGTLPRSIASTVVGGQVHLIGVLTKGQIDPLSLMSGKTLRALAVGSRRDHEDMNVAVSHHLVRPLIDSVFAFDAAEAAYQRLASGEQVGKIVVKIADDAVL